MSSTPTTKPTKPLKKLFLVETKPLATLDNQLSPILFDPIQLRS
jgi:hypothetical protein